MILLVFLYFQPGGPDEIVELFSVDGTVNSNICQPPRPLEKSTCKL